MTFTLHTIETAPQESKPLLEAASRAWKFIPKLNAILAESPIALEAYESLFRLVGKSSLSPIEQQVAFLAVSVFHGCEYCTAGHTYLAHSAGVPKPVVEALRRGTKLPDQHLEALRRFVTEVLQTRGAAGDAAVEAFLNAGFTRAHVLETVVVIATKTISNYVNHLTHTPLETFMSDPALRWISQRGEARGVAQLANSADAGGR
jgi:AhpD family alkylhydroperoxidase